MVERLPTVMPGQMPGKMLLLAATVGVARGQAMPASYGYETDIYHCVPGSSQQQWKVINGRARQRTTDLCLTIDSCQAPAGPDGLDNGAVMEHCGKGCWADTMINRVSQQWELPSATDGAGLVQSRATIELEGEEQPLCLSFGSPASGAEDPRVLVRACSNATQWRYVPVAGRSDYHLLQIEFPPGVDNSSACIGGPPCCLGTRNLGRSAALHAMLAQFFAAAALPLGAMLGVVAAPVHPGVVAALNAFGAGALIFALSVQVYAEILLSLGARTSGGVQIALGLVCTILGAVSYNFFSHKLRETVQPFKPGVQGMAFSDMPAGASLQSDGGLNAPLLSSAPGDNLSDTGSSGGGHDEAADGSVEAGEPEPAGSGDDDSDAGDDESAAETGQLSSVLAAERHLAALLWLSCWVDLVPQAVLIGLLAGERALHASLVIALALANLPQAFSSAALLREHDAASPGVTMLAWTLVATVAVLLAGFSGLLTPVNMHDDVAGTSVRDSFVSALAGLCAGALLAMATATMLPAAYERAGKQVRHSPPFTFGTTFLPSCSRLDSHFR